MKAETVASHVYLHHNGLLKNIRVRLNKSQKNYIPDKIFTLPFLHSNWTKNQKQGTDHQSVQAAEQYDKTTIRGQLLQNAK